MERRVCVLACWYTLAGGIFGEMISLPPANHLNPFAVVATQAIRKQTVLILISIDPGSK